ncbi:hypothetical protein D018_0914B, partial [Vibrio parahaemolyticus VP2007-007]
MTDDGIEHNTKNN